MPNASLPVRRIRRLALVLASLAVGLVLCEIALRIWNPIALRMRGDEILLPNNVLFQFENIASEKLERNIRVQRNSLGFRGPEPPANFENALTIVAVGGSTTECWAQTDGKTWCDLLARDLDAHLDRLWLNNAGLDGHSTFGHMMLMDQVLQKLHPDYILLLVGVNDLDRSDLNQHDASMKLENASLSRRLIRASVLLSTIQTMWRSLAAKNLGLQHKWELDPRKEASGADTAEEELIFLKRQTDINLPGYKSRLRALIKQATDHGIRPILITQPSLFGDFLDPDTGVPFGDVHFAGRCVRTRGKGLDLFNAATRTIAMEAGVPCIDLATELPQRSSLYYDWIHYSDRGAEMVAKILAQHLRILLADAHPEHRR